MLSSNWKDQVAIDGQNIDQNLIDQPGLFAYYAELAVRSDHEYRTSKEALAVLEAQVAQEIRDRYIHSGNKITVKQTEVETSLDPRVQRMRSDVNSLKLQRDLTKVACDSFNQRLQSLIALGKIRSNEYHSSDPHVYASRAIDDRVRSVRLNESSTREETPSMGKPRRY